MMIKKHLWIWLMLVALTVKGQVSMTVQLPATGVMLRSQLWNIMLVSASDNPVYVKIMLRLSDAQTNQPLLTGVSRTVILTKGARQIQAEIVNPVQYEYLSPAVDRSVNGMLMAGSYVACYSVVADNAHFNNLLAEDCLPFTVEPVSPPLLNMPADQSVLETTLPQFTWLPPAPLNIFNDLNYEMKLVEVRSGQSPAEAIQQNIPVFRAPHNKNLFVNYPASAVALDSTRTYAWTVTANNGLRFAAQTEIWTFRLANNKAKEATAVYAYVQLKKVLDATVTNCSGTLQLLYNNEANDKTVKYEIVALQKGNKVIQDGELKLQRGENLLDLLLKKSRFDEGDNYLFRLSNSRQERWNMKFIYIK